ncbi:sensor histidine kinase [Paenibacillus sp. HJL G12]|uniref:histidine kinase n=1 Tax=Paenibacillus dendrobii TaxID=2691084 RepID=A0A7X3IMZ1_9BACL|nr:HAMP domain-containing sensor histidine kinase [Paenibacillus dendrobii]MWV46938.1 sensor histidine kinase [Paenibacillus dendrobii]
MKIVSKTAVALVLALTLISLWIPVSVFAAQDTGYPPIAGWDFKWEQPNTAAGLIESPSQDRGGWVRLNSLNNLPARDQQNQDAWYKTVLPELQSDSSALLLKKIYGRHIIIYLDGHERYEQNRSYMYDDSKILLPLNAGDAGKTLYIQVLAEKDRMGLQGEVVYGDYQKLLTQYVKSYLDDLILGSSMIFLGLVMLIAALFMRKSQLVSWLALMLVLLSIGAMILTYSPLLYSLFTGYGEVFLIVYDLALLTLLPSLTYYFEKTVGAGYKQIIRHFRKFQMVYSLFCLGFMAMNVLMKDRYFDLYYLFSVKILGYLIILQIILVVGSAIAYTVKGSRDALVFTLGFGVFGLTVLIEMICFMASQGSYELVWWKWGVLGFAIALIAVLGQKFAKNHQQILVYSRELEMFNRELQRSEKMEIISELAASVAHEVRNPLQVTRGFLQLLQGKSQNKDREYITLALKELDRASSIITDFLTFAKPEIDHVQLLELSDEFRHIEGILVPLANFQGSKMTSRIPKGLYIEGNSSKFKQAFINIVKNSIEALQEDGQIHIWAYMEQEEVVIHIRDNGEGMEPAEMARLGEPYFSNKTKGTGLGLMVTFRIIEVMRGELTFHSKKGVGTEVIVRFPAASGGETLSS